MLSGYPQRTLKLALWLCIFSVHFSFARDFFVSPEGSDANPGTLEQPFETLAKATPVLEPGDTCYLREGTYYEVLRPIRSGTAAQPITFRNFEQERVIFSATERMQGWIAQDGGVYAAPLDEDLGHRNQFFCNGLMLTEAAWPSSEPGLLFQPHQAVVAEGTPNSIVCEELPGTSKDWEGARLRCAGGAAWIFWSAIVTNYNTEMQRLEFDQPAQQNGGPNLDLWFYKPKTGNRFSLFGVRRALDAPGEWWVDAEQKELMMIPPAGVDMTSAQLERKARLDTVDLSGRSYIHLQGFEFFAGGIRMDASCEGNTLNGLTGRYVSHSSTKEEALNAGVLVMGQSNLVINCDIGYSTSSILTVQGQDHRIINNYLHHGSYGGLWRASVTLEGRRIVFSHNTVKHSGRDLIKITNLMESLIQYNDLSNAGWLISDLGMIYGHNTDFMNTRICYNYVHDNHARHYAMGIYFDHLSQNAIVDHNVIWNVGWNPIQINNPSYSCLVFNNTCWKTGRIETFDHSGRNDLHLVRYMNNLFNAAIDLPEHAILEGNRIEAVPEFVDRTVHDYRLVSTNLAARIGAYGPTDSLWRVGWKKDNPPAPLPTYRAPDVPWMNKVHNAAFELGTLEGWRILDGRAELVDGNDWGNEWGTIPATPTGTSRFVLRLGPEASEVSQQIDGLSPNTSYTLSAWTCVADAGQAVTLGVRDFEGPTAQSSSSSAEWVRQEINFTTGPEATSAILFIQQPTSSAGFVWCDNIILPNTPSASGN